MISQCFQFCLIYSSLLFILLVHIIPNHDFRSQKSLKQDVTRKPPLPKLGGILSPSCHHPPLQFPVPEETNPTGSRLVILVP